MISEEEEQAPCYCTDCHYMVLLVQDHAKPVSRTLRLRLRSSYSQESDGRIRCFHDIWDSDQPSKTNILTEINRVNRSKCMFFAKNSPGVTFDEMDARRHRAETTRQIAENHAQMLDEMKESKVFQVMILLLTLFIVTEIVVSCS